MCPEGIFAQIGTIAQVKPAMRRVALIYNPASGQISARRTAAVEDALAVFRDAGVEAEAFVTREAGEATVHAQQAVRDGYDTILACGGDGTVHEIVQSLVGTDIALGVVPLGTANALASDLGLIGDDRPRWRASCSTPSRHAFPLGASTTGTAPEIQVHATLLSRRESAPMRC